MVRFSNCGENSISFSVLFQIQLTHFQQKKEENKNLSREFIYKNVYKILTV